MRKTIPADRHLTTGLLRRTQLAAQLHRLGMADDHAIGQVQDRIPRPHQHHRPGEPDERRKLAAARGLGESQL